MALLSRDSILKAQDVQTRDIEVPEWGGSIRVRTMTVAERLEFVRRVSDPKDTHSAAAWLLAELSVDANGARLFQPEDVVELEKRNFRAVESVVSVIIELNGMAAQIEAAEKK